MAQNKVGEQAILQAVQILESQIDNEIDKFENLQDEDFDKIRQNRILEMKNKAKKHEEYISKGHGIYHELFDDKDFFTQTKECSRIVVHFFRPSTMRCQIFDKHLEKLATKHVETKFFKINVEKSTFLVHRLSVKVLPTIICIVDGNTKPHIIGFTDLGNRDDFSTEMLEWRLAVDGAIEYNGNLLEPPDSSSSTDKPKKGNPFQRKVIRNKTGGNDSDSDEYAD